MVLPGITALVPAAATEPIPWLILTDVAPATLQIRVDVCPAFICIGVAVNVTIFGKLDGGLTVIVVEPVIDPAELVAVKT